MSRVLRHAILNQLNLSTSANAQTAWGSFRPHEWERALAWLDLSGLAIYFLQRMKTANSLDLLPLNAREELEKRYAANRIRTVDILQEFRTFIEAFEQARVTYAVLKGVSLLPDYCPDMAFRTQYDHDVLVAPDSLNAARRELERTGFQPRLESGSDAPLVYRRAETKVRFSQNSEALYSPRLGRSIELHRTLWEEDEERIRVCLSNDFLERGRHREWKGIPFRALSDEDGLLFQVLHAFKHILRNWCRLSIFLEIGCFLKSRARDSEFWRAFAGRIANLRRAREATLLVFTLSEQLFGAVTPGPVRELLRSPLTPALHLWIERYGGRSALSNFHDDKSSLFLHREFIDDPSEWASIRRRRLFPLHRPHRPPAVVFQRGFSALGRRWMEKIHALRRLKFHGVAGLRYVAEYPRWVVLRRLRLSASENG